MAINYKIDFTDNNQNRSIIIPPFVTDGADSPTATFPASGTSLTLYGKGTPSFGEGMAENLVHLLEHFSGAVEPAFPVNGQLWYDTSGVQPQLRVFHTQKYVIIPTDPLEPVGPTWLTVAGDQTTRFTTALKIRAYDYTDPIEPSQEDYQVIVSGYLDANGNTVFQVSGPTVYIVGQYIGGWEYIVQQNTPYTNDMDANSFTLRNLPDFATTDLTDNLQAVSRDYVDQTIFNSVSAADQLSELTDVTLTSIATGEIIYYNAGLWVNGTGSDIGVLELAGGIMSGTLDMDSNPLINVPGPSLSHHAANKQYVDDELLSVAAPTTTLQGMSDTNFTSPVADDVLQHNGSYWVTKSKTAFVTNLNVVDRAGDNMTGYLTLHANPTSNLHAATKQYVDGLTVPPNDVFVNGGNFNPVSNQLTLTRAAGAGDVVITGVRPSSYPTLDVTHDILSPASIGSSQNIPRLYLEDEFGTLGTYPTIPLSSVVTRINQDLGRLSSPRRRITFESNGLAIVDLGDTITTPVVGQCHVAMNPKISWPSSTNVLSVYVNGVKWIADDPIHHSFANTLSGGLWPSYETGLVNSLATLYGITVRQYNGTIWTDYEVTVIGQYCQTMGDLIVQLNLNSAGAFTVSLYDDNLVFSMNYDAPTKDIQVLDGNTVPSVLNLFSSLVGVSTPITLGTGDFNTGTTLPPPLIHGYLEAAAPGVMTDRFTFTAGTVPAAGATIEIIVDNTLDKAIF